MLGAFANFAACLLGPACAWEAATALPFAVPRPEVDPAPARDPEPDAEELDLSKDVTADPRPVTATREPPSLRAHFCSRSMS